MSSPSTAPVPAPKSDLSMAVKAVIQLVVTLLGVFGGMQTHTLVNPPKPPAPIAVPPEPAPPVVPQASITVNDSTGSPISGPVRPGQQLVLRSDKAVYGIKPDSIKWTVTPACETTVIFGGLVLTTPNIQTTLTIQQVVALNDSIDTHTITLQVGSPPPEPDKKIPPPPPATSKKLLIGVVEDSQNRNKAQSQFLEQLATWKEFKAAGNDWAIHHAGKTPDTSAAASADIAAVKAASGAIPSVVIRDKSTGTVQYTGPPPGSLAELQALVARLGGSF